MGDTNHLDVGGAQEHISLVKTDTLNIHETAGTLITAITNLHGDSWQGNAAEGAEASGGTLKGVLDDLLEQLEEINEREDVDIDHIIEQDNAINLDGPLPQQ